MSHHGQYLPNHKHIIDNPNSTIMARVLAGHLLEHQMSLSEFEKATKIDHSMASKVLNGTRCFSRFQIPALAEFLGLEPEDVALLIAGFDPKEFRSRIIGGYVRAFNESVAEAMKEFW